jgi:hypothetical protein
MDSEGVEVLGRRLQLGEARQKVSNLFVAGVLRLEQDLPISLND